MSINELLPIGTIVLLEGGQKKLMIYGIKQTTTEDEQEVEYDYIGTLYPEGFIGAEYQLLFNHEDISEVVYIGYNDEERAQFIKRLSAFYNDK